MSCIVLTSITWMNERLWPEGYSLFSNVKQWPIVRNFFDSYYSVPLENLSKARRIVIADGEGSSAVFYNSDKTFEKVYGEIGDLMKSFLLGEAKIKSETSLSKENVRQMLNEQVMYAYVSYPVATSNKMFARLMGTQQTDVLKDISAVRDFFIFPTGEESLELLCVDYEDESVMRYEIGYSHTGELIALFSEYIDNVDPEHNCMLALEMNMDILPDDTMVEVSTILDSFLVLDSASTATSNRTTIKSINLLEIEPEENIKKVVSCFGYNPESLYSYVDTEGTTVYIENDSMLKIYKNGIIEFSATDSSYGIALESTGSLYEELNSAIRFAGRVYSAITSQPFNVNVSGELLDESSGEKHLTFDYYCAGTPVTSHVRVGDKTIENAIEMTVSNGYITEFLMLLRDYEETQELDRVITVYEAIDKVAEYTNSDDPIVIEDIFLSYHEYGNNDFMQAGWTGYTGGNRIIIQNN